LTTDRQTRLGILACPGGRTFANEIIHHLESIYKRRVEKRIEHLSRGYGLSHEEVIRRINFDQDLHSKEIADIQNINSIRKPVFEIPTHFTRFANGEFKTEILTTVRGVDLYIVQDVANQYPLRFEGDKNEFVLSINDHIFCLLTTVDAALQAGAESVTLVLPSYPYARQHKKKGREGLTASRIGRMFESMGVARIITLDIHSREIENAFNSLILENLHASYQILLKLSELIDIHDPDIVVVSPDTGAVDRNKFYASSIQRPLALLYKERDYSKLSSSANESNITTTKLLGDVRNKIVFTADDMLGTGGTLIKAMRLMKSMGAREIYASVSLPLFNGTAIEEFDEAYREGLFNKIIGTNAVYHNERLLNRPWFCQANVSNFFARAISRLHHKRSLSSLLDNSAMIQKLFKTQE